VFTLVWQVVYWWKIFRTHVSPFITCNWYHKKIFKIVLDILLYAKFITLGVNSVEICIRYWYFRCTEKNYSKIEGTTRFLCDKISKMQVAICDTVYPERNNNVLTVFFNNTLSTLLHVSKIPSNTRKHKQQNGMFRVLSI